MSEPRKLNPFALNIMTCHDTQPLKNRSLRPDASHRPRDSHASVGNGGGQTPCWFFSWLTWLPRVVFLPLLLAGCQGQAWNKTLPDLKLLKLRRGLTTYRLITHLHSELSYDACDTGNTHCRQDLRDALCQNRIDFALLSDHPRHMATTPFNQLHLHDPQDLSLANAAGQVIGNHFDCANGHSVRVMAGYEDQLMPLAMENHLSADFQANLELYTTVSPALVARLQQETAALVFIPHTESRSLELLSSLQVTGIEIYNLHANIHPEMRTQFLGFDHFSGLADLAPYWFDPFRRHLPDLAFLPFLKRSPVYSQKWDALLSQGQKIVGLAGNDSHQNFFSGLASDDERVDSHRRLTRWILNHTLLPPLDGAFPLATLKAAVAAGQGWAVFEGLGTPQGEDFFASNPLDVHTTTEMGGSLALIPGETLLTVTPPSLHPDSPGYVSSRAPQVNFRLLRIAFDGQGQQEIVLSGQNATQSLQFKVTQAGAYRVEFDIIPLHLMPFLAYKKSLAAEEFPWLISNPIYLQ